MTYRAISFEFNAVAAHFSNNTRNVDSSFVTDNSLIFSVDIRQASWSPNL